MDALGTNRRISSVTREPVWTFRVVKRPRRENAECGERKPTVQTSDAALVEIPK